MRKHVVVHGRVQGVFFRDSTRQRAQAAGVAGWVANRADGTVEAVFEGDDDAVETLVRWVEEQRQPSLLAPRRARRRSGRASSSVSLADRLRSADAHG